jgi:hypothetical protein
MISEPKSLEGVDWSKLSALENQAQHFAKSGRMTKDQYKQLEDQALTAAKGQRSLLNTLEMFRP